MGKKATVSRDAQLDDKTIKKHKKAVSKSARIVIVLGERRFSLKEGTWKVFWIVWQISIS